MKVRHKPNLTDHQKRDETLALNWPQLQCQRGDDFEACAMTAVYLRRVDPARNMRRFYRLDIAPDLFGGFLLLKQWGRIGAGGQIKAERYESADLAAAALRQQAAKEAARI